MRYFCSPKPIILMVLSLLLLTISSCNGCNENKIALPKEDSTPPTYKWVVQVQNNNSDQHEFTSSGQQLQLNKDYQYRVFFIAYDNDGGVKKVSMNGGGRTACRQSPVDNIEVVNCQSNSVLYPDINGKVESMAFSFCAFDMTCRYASDSLFAQVITGPGGMVTLTGYAENYHTGKATSKLYIINQP